MNECRRVAIISERQRRVSRTVFFTDKEVFNVVSQTELNIVVGLAFRYDEAELALIHEQDMPLDRSGLVQRYIAIQLRYEFEWTKSPSTPNTAHAFRHQ
jgi:hypothetical protein